MEIAPASIEAIPANRISSMLEIAPANPLRKTRFVRSPSDIPKAELPM
jgi:hypothetical protein